MKTLGIFFIGVLLLSLGILIYVVLKKCPGKCNTVFGKVRSLIEKKLFYSGLLRYVIVSYIKLMNQFFNMFCLGLVTGVAIIMQSVYGAMIAALLVWPVWTLWLLIGDRRKLGKPKHLAKFGTLY